MRDELPTSAPLNRHSYALPHPLALALLSVLMFGVTFATSAGAAEPDRERTAKLTHMVRQDCGSCHGLTFAGGLGPPLAPSALKGKPVAYIKHVILHGAKDTAMPGWAALLSESDAEWIAERLLGGFPDAR